MSALHINLSFVLSVCQKLSKLVDILRTGDTTFLHRFFGDTVYNHDDNNDDDDVLNASR